MFGQMVIEYHGQKEKKRYLFVICSFWCSVNESMAVAPRTFVPVSFSLQQYFTRTSSDQKSN
jgi:hypothetical protein